jgi:hypothetical protein
MLAAPHVAFVVHGRSDALARARAVLPHLRGRATVLEDTHDIGEAVRQGLAVDLLVVDGGVDPWQIATGTDAPVVGVRGLTWAGPADPVAPGPVAWLAPFPAVLDRSGAPPEVQERTLYAGLLSPSTGSRLTRAAARRRLGLDVHGRHLTVAFEGGVGAEDLERITAAAARAPSWSFSVVGVDRVASCSSGRVLLEPDAANLVTHLVAADAVLSDGSLSILADVVTARRPLAVLAARTGADEAPALGETLEATRAAILLSTWPPDVAWPALLAELLDHPTRPLAHLDDGRGPRRAAAWLEGWALDAPVAAAVS